MKPTLFIGSSKEGIETARAIEVQLEEDAKVTIWKAGVFGLGKGTLESLAMALDQFDFAVLVLTPDDMTISREIISQSPRGTAQLPRCV
jgi:predicted nucleotide-binding protein